MKAPRPVEVVNPAAAKTNGPNTVKVTPPPSAAPPSHPTTLPAPSSGRMALSKVVSGRLAKPMRLLVYGLEGVGKSTFAASASSPIFLGAEDGTSELDVRRFPQPTCFADGMEAIVELTTQPHDYQTLVLDTLDWFEPLVWQQVCIAMAKPGRPPLRSIEEPGYGKGYVEAGGYWRQLTAALERLRVARRMDVILLAHSWIKSFKNPSGEDYDRFEMKLHKGAAGMWREWCDAVLFADHDVTTYEDDRKRVKGIGSGARVLRTTHNAAYDAKNRYDLPPSLPLDWETFAEAALAHRPDDPERLRRRIEQLLEQVADDAKLVTRVRNSVESAADNASELERIWNKLAARISTTPIDDEEAPQ